MSLDRRSTPSRLFSLMILTLVMSLFPMRAQGAWEGLHSFSGSDGQYPAAPPIGLPGDTIPWTPDSKRGQVTSSSITASGLVAYRSFYGADYMLHEFRGINVRLLVPDAWRVTGALTVEEIEHLVDRSDLLYDLTRELTGGEPQGEGLLTIAFVDVGPYGGLGYVGHKGVEISWGEWQLDLLKDQGDVNGYFIHEMNHNFDIHHAKLHYLADHAHAWTWSMDSLVRASLHLNRRPGDHLREGIYDRYAEWLDESAFTWTDCIADARSSCDFDRNGVWGTIRLRLAELHGIEAIRKANQFVAAQSSLPQTAEEKEVLHIRALSDGAGVSITCYLDAWRWLIPEPLRAELDGMPQNANCVDGDGDGFSVFKGDFDDSNAAAYPGAMEIANGVDDDGNGIVDDLLFEEPTAGDFTPEMVIPYPARLRGRLVEGDWDTFSTMIPTSRKVAFRLRSLDQFQGWLFLYTEANAWLAYTHVGAGNTSVLEIELPQGSRRFSIDLNTVSNPGSWELSFGDASIWPLKWGTISSTRNGSEIQFHVSDLLGDAFTTTPDRLRVWVRGNGWVGEIPAAPEGGTLNWTAPTADRARYSVIPYAGAIPAGLTTLGGKTAPAGAPPGDANGDGALGVSDIFYLINHLFASGPAPIGSGDANGDGVVSVSDIFYLINHLFAGGPAPL